MVDNTDKKRILVVEDEPVISNVCVRVLTDDGCEVDVASNGRMAENMIEKRGYDLYLIDIRTPVMNGKELFQFINEKHPELTSRVVFTTGDLIGGDTRSFLEGTGRPFLSKPFTPNDLRAIVNEAFRRM
jgi:DNA-binding response OmpR family regulator